MNAVTKQTMVELDERMIHQYKIPLEKMLESAGKGLAALIQELYPDATRILVLAGSGNNAGGGFVAARHLSEKGYDVRVILVREECFLKPVPKTQYEQLPDSIMTGISSEASDEDLSQLIQQSSVVIDALLGYGTDGAAVGEVRRLIESANTHARQVVALDFPSGLNPDEGPTEEPVMRADTTLAIALPKEGHLYEDAQEYIGDLYVVDINVPDVWFREQEFIRPPYGSRGYVHVSLVP